jgi:aspartate-semialdehyde dehydrogenase
VTAARAWAGDARVALVGADSRRGAELKAALEHREFPGDRIDLYGRSGDDAVVSEYAGEARLIQEPDPEEIALHDIVFLCDAEAAAMTLPSEARNPIVVDLSGLAWAEGRAVLAHPDLSPVPADGPLERISCPHPISVLLASLLLPLERAFGIASATAVVLRPASDFGEAGLEELRDQTLRLLRFESASTEVFGRQLAFNLLPQGLLRTVEGEDLEARVEAEVAALAGWSVPRLAASLVTAPLFYGHAVAVRVEPERPADADRLALALEEGGRVTVASQAGNLTPLEAAAGSKLTVSGLSVDARGGCRFWAVAGEAGGSAAEDVVRLAESLGLR